MHTVYGLGSACENLPLTGWGEGRLWSEKGQMLRQILWQ